MSAGKRLLKASAGFTATVDVQASTAVDITPRIFTATIAINSDGTCTQTGQDSTFPGTYDWIDPTGDADQCEVRMTSVSGQLLGTTETWLDCASNQSWQRTSSSFGTTTATCQIRDKASQTIQDSATFTWQTGE